MSRQKIRTRRQRVGRRRRLLSTGQAAGRSAYADSRFAQDYNGSPLRTRVGDLKAETAGTGDEGILSDRKGAGKRPTGSMTGVPAFQKVSVAAPSVLFPAHIRAPSTPKGVPDRIPPRVDTTVNIAVMGWSIPMSSIQISVEGAGAGNGDLLIDGKATTDLTAPAAVKLRGTTQTSPGNAGRLRLVAKQGGTILSRSDPFSVAAIPQNWSFTFKNMLTGPKRGFVVQDNWESDSGNIVDLNETEISEEVQYGGGSGCFAGVAGSNSGYLPGHKLTTDSHGVKTSVLTKSGKLVAKQTSKFKDKRTGAKDIPMTNSGYLITRSVMSIPFAGLRFITTTKVGAKTKANKIESDAGAGAESRLQRV